MLLLPKLQAINGNENIPAFLRKQFPAPCLLPLPRCLELFMISLPLLAPLLSFSLGFNIFRGTSCLSCFSKGELWRTGRALWSSQVRRKLGVNLVVLITPCSCQELEIHSLWCHKQEEIHWECPALLGYRSSRNNLGAWAVPWNWFTI